LRCGSNEDAGVCRDFTHLAVTLCRCMNIPARYCTGYLGGGCLVALTPRRYPD
jgi:transglutaminase-like putative cysteine protease